MHDRTPAAAAELAAVDSGHPDPNGLHQELRVALSSTPVASAVHLVAEMAKTTPAAASGSPAAKRRQPTLTLTPGGPWLTPLSQ